MKAIITFNDRYWYDLSISEPWRLASSQFSYFSVPSNGYINGDVIVINSQSGVADIANSGKVQVGDIMYFCGTDGMVFPSH